MKKPCTENGLRVFTCKRCGRQESLNVYRWRKTPQHLKNVCTECLKKAELRRQTARERVTDMDYYFQTGRISCTYIIESYRYRKKAVQ